MARRQLMAAEVKTVTPQAAEVSICDGCALGGGQ
jgi:hypothetical protein